MSIFGPRPALERLVPRQIHSNMVDYLETTKEFSLFCRSCVFLTGHAQHLFWRKETHHKIKSHEEQQMHILTAGMDGRLRLFLHFYCPLPSSMRGSSPSKEGLSAAEGSCETPEASKS